MKKLLLKIISLASPWIFVQPASAQFAPNFVELFDSNNLQLQGWNLYSGNFGSSKNACFNPSNISVADGKLTLAITKSNNTCNRLYSTSGVSAPNWQVGQTYGKWEVVAKMPSVKGTTAYIGLYAIGAWPPEIVFEHVPSEPNNLHLAQHYTSSGNKYEGKILSGTSWGAGFHKYTLEWVPPFDKAQGTGQIRYFVDDVLRHTMTQKFASRPMFLSIATDTYNCGAWGGCPEQFGSTLPASMQVESVKIWKHDASIPLPAPSQPPTINNLPIGRIDLITPGGIAYGWAVDPDAQDHPINVYFYLDAPVEQGGKFIGSVSANVYHPYINQIGYRGSHAFGWNIPQQYRDGKQHKLYAYGIDAILNSQNSILEGSGKIFILR